MEFKRFPEPIASILARPDFQPLLAGVTITLARGLPTSFVVPDGGQIVLGAAAAHGAVAVRHALELALMLRLCPDRPLLAGLAAARTAAAFAGLEPPGLSSAMQGELGQVDGPTDPFRLAALWPALAVHQPGAGLVVPGDTAAALAALWPLLGPADWVMETGGDARLRIDPVTGVNRYGASYRPRPWEITYASSTASSCSARGYAAAEASRQQAIAATLDGRDGAAEALARVRQDIAAYYDLPTGCGVVLAASGTDAELLALALAQMHDSGRPVANILIASEETGTGVPLAAIGCHFAEDTACGHVVTKGALIAGFRADTTSPQVALRAPGVAVHAPGVVDASCLALSETAVTAGQRVLLHRLDVSKTGLAGPSPDAIRQIVSDHPGDVDVVVDACQARLIPARVHNYVAAGWMVMITGSKFFTGPPFAGALLVPSAILARLETGALPVGLAAYSSRAEWPALAAHQAALSGQGNIGLALRWRAALAEMGEFDAVGGTARSQAIGAFTSQVRQAVRQSDDLRLIDVPVLNRGAPDGDWDGHGTIISFAVLDPVDRLPMSGGAIRDLYLWLNMDLTPLLPGLDAPDHHLARRRFHIGQPVILAGPAGEWGALRISASARLAFGLVKRDVAIALAALDKVSLILRHLPVLRSTDSPVPVAISRGPGS
jgi:hypothetical protein